MKKGFVAAIFLVAALTLLAFTQYMTPEAIQGKELGSLMSKNGNEVVATVGKEAITADDISIAQFIYESSENKSISKDEVIEIVAVDKAAVLEADSRGLTLSKSEEDAIYQRALERGNNSTENASKDDSFIKAAGLSSDELVQLVAEQEIIAEKKLLLEDEIYEQIFIGTLPCNSEAMESKMNEATSYIAKYKEGGNEDDLKNAIDAAKEVMNMYYDGLVDKHTIKREVN